MGDNIDSALFLKDERVKCLCTSLYKKAYGYWRLIGRPYEFIIKNYMIHVDGNGNLRVLYYTSKWLKRFGLHKEIHILRYGPSWACQKFTLDMFDLFGFFMDELDEKVAVIEDNKMLDKEYVNVIIDLSIG